MSEVATAFYRVTECYSATEYYGVLQSVSTIVLRKIKTRHTSKKARVRVPNGMNFGKVLKGS